MKILVALIASGFAFSANACTPQIHVWVPGTPPPHTVVEGLVTGDIRSGVWERTIHVQPRMSLRGKWKTDLDVQVPCGADSPRLGDDVLVVKLAHDSKTWILIPPWQEDEFRAFLRETKRSRKDRDTQVLSPR
ncbi:hypothetical protein [Lysobacter brunescens]|uniref:Uncharacterized protein n=1 Tax=Lysobacter brunescens TaxID=262323 RepID=A0ABW2Y8K6_9GAMM